MRRLVLAILLSASTAPAQMRWNRLTPNAAPATVERHAMVTTLRPRGILLFGGAAETETWRFAGGQWSRLNPPVSPGKRSGFVMAYNEATNRVVLFGGFSTVWLQDTWEWDGANWTKHTPPVSPPARSRAAMAFEPISSSVLLHGGMNRSGYLADTWSWDGTTWSRVNAPYAPGPRVGAAMATDGTDGILLFGGFDPFGPLDDSWDFRGHSWTRRTWGARAPPRGYHSLTFDPDRRRFVLHGGRTSGGSSVGDTWETLYGGWVPSGPATPGPAVSMHAAAYDAEARQVLVYGGWTWTGSESGGQHVRTNETFAYTQTVHHSISQLGNGCGGVQGLTFMSSPIVGESWFGFEPWPRFRQPTLPSVAVLAFSPRTPPRRYGWYCQLYPAPPFSTILGAAPGARIRLPIPALPAMSGLRFYVQTIDAERTPGTGWRGLAFSPGYEIVVGD